MFTMKDTVPPSLRTSLPKGKEGQPWKLETLDTDWYAYNCNAPEKTSNDPSQTTEKTSKNEPKNVSQEPHALIIPAWLLLVNVVVFFGFVKFLVQIILLCKTIY